MMKAVLFGKMIATFSRNLLNRKILILHSVYILLFCLLSAAYIAPAYAQQQFEWAKTGRGDNIDQSNAVAVDGKGNTYIIGGYTNAIDFNTGSGKITLTPRATEPSGSFLAKYAPDGNCIWAISIGGTGYIIGADVALDNTGNVYITGAYIGDSYFDPNSNTITLNNLGSNYNIYIAKYDTDGKYIWAKGIGGSGTHHGQGIDVDDKGNAYVTGRFTQMIDFNPGTGSTAILNPIAPGTSSLFIAKYDTDGNYVWAITPGQGNGLGLATDNAGKVYVTGTISTDSTDFSLGAGTAVFKTTTANTSDVFIVKYDTDGKYIWAKVMGSTRNDYGMAVATDLSGSNVYITGSFMDSINFNPGSSSTTLKAAGSSDVYIARFDADGRYIWSKSTGGTGSDQGQKVTVDHNNNVYVAGYFSASVNFNPVGTGATHTSAGLTDAFVARYDSDGSYLWSKSIENAYNDQSQGIAVDRSGNVYVTGYFGFPTFGWGGYVGGGGAVDFNPGGSGGIDNSAGLADIFLVKYACVDTSASFLQVSTCKGSYTLNDSVYSIDGIYTQVVPNTISCDSTITLELIFYVIKPDITIEEFVLGVSGTYATYQWIKDDTDISGATNPTYAVTENGNYRVKVTNEDGCEGISDVYPVSNVSIGDLVNQLGQHVHIYPIPAEEVIHINSPVNVNINLCNIAGSSMLYMENAITVPVNSLAKGMYLLRITDKEGRLIKVEKIIKQ